MIVERLFQHNGLRNDCGALIHTLLREAGFEAVRSFGNKIPVGKKSGKIGMLGTDAFIGAMTNLSSAIGKAGGLGIVDTEDEWMRLLVRVAEEWEEVEDVCYKAQTICALKPA